LLCMPVASRSRLLLNSFVSRSRRKKSANASFTFSRLPTIPAWHASGMCTYRARGRGLAHFLRRGAVHGHVLPSRHHQHGHLSSVEQRQHVHGCVFLARHEHRVLRAAVHSSQVLVKRFKVSKRHARDSQNTSEEVRDFWKVVRQREDDVPQEREGSGGNTPCKTQSGRLFAVRNTRSPSSVEPFPKRARRLSRIARVNGTTPAPPGIPWSTPRASPSLYPPVPARLCRTTPAPSHPRRRRWSPCSDFSDHPTRRARGNPTRRARGRARPAIRLSRTTETRRCSSRSRARSRGAS